MTVTNSKAVVQELFSLLKSKTITPLRMARVVHLLKDKHGIPVAKIAKMMGRSGAQVYNMAQVYHYPIEVKQYIQNGKLEVTEAMNLSRNKKSLNHFINLANEFVEKKEKKSISSAKALLILNKASQINTFSREEKKKLCVELGKILFELTGIKQPTRVITKSANTLLAFV